MRNYLIIFVFIFFANCSFHKNENGATDKKISQNKINLSKVDTFEEYANLLLNQNRFKGYPDINKVPD